MKFKNYIAMGLLAWGLGTATPAFSQEKQENTKTEQMTDGEKYLAIFDANKEKYLDAKNQGNYTGLTSVDAIVDITLEAENLKEKDRDSILIQVHKMVRKYANLSKQSNPNNKSKLTSMGDLFDLGYTNNTDGSKDVKLSFSASSFIDDLDTKKFYSDPEVPFGLKAAVAGVIQANLLEGCDPCLEEKVEEKEDKTKPKRVQTGWGIGAGVIKPFAGDDKTTASELGGYFGFHTPAFGIVNLNVSGYAGVSFETNDVSRTTDQVEISNLGTRHEDVWDRGDITEKNIYAGIGPGLVVGDFQLFSEVLLGLSKNTPVETNYHLAYRDTNGDGVYDEVTQGLVADNSADLETKTNFEVMGLRAGGRYYINKNLALAVGGTYTTDGNFAGDLGLYISINKKK